MSAGLFGLLDDVAALARLAAASVDDVGMAAGRATTKAAGVVVDDTAVTPQYVHGVAAERELPIVKKIAKGSLRNKLLFILPVALLLSEFLPDLVTVILMLGACYLCYEGAEKVWERISGHATGHEVPVTTVSHDAEDDMVAGAIRTDFILSAEIMVIALNEVSEEGFLARLAILAVVAVVITIAVYGVVGLIVKMDDVGLALSQRKAAASQKIGHALVAGMPALLSFISVVGVAAMLWVGGHILLVGGDELGWHAPYDLLHDIEHEVEHAIAFASGAFGWIANTLVSAVVGLAIGAVIVLVMHFLPFGHGGQDEHDGRHHGAAPDLP